MQHKDCGGYLVEGPSGYPGLVCQKCNSDIHLDSEVDEFPERVWLWPNDPYWYVVGLKQDGDVVYERVKN